MPLPDAAPWKRMSMLYPLIVGHLLLHAAEERDT